MAEKKTFEERYADEVLSDDTQKPKCEQCKDCIFGMMERYIPAITQKAVAGCTLIQSSNRLRL